MFDLIDTPWIFWPIAIPLRLLGIFISLLAHLAGAIVGLIFEITVGVAARLLCAFVGLLLVGIGVLLSLTIIGAIVGIPLAFAGVMVIFRGLLG